MPKSEIFHTDLYHTIETRLVEFLNAHPKFLSTQTAKSTRAVGDAIQDIISEHFQSLLGAVISEYSAQFARRAMADLAFSDRQGLYYIVDVKTHRIGTAFNMPNLTSVKRIARFYEDDNNFFVLLIVKYRIEATAVLVDRVHFVPIEFLSWDCLTIGALGWGQIQIANANRITIIPQYSRKRWMLDLCDTLLRFYPKEIEKIKDRISHFQAIHREWEKRGE